MPTVRGGPPVDEAPGEGRRTASPPQGSATSGGASRNLARLLEAAAARDPGGTALVVARTGERLTFGALDAWSDRLAHGLSARGVARGARALVLVRPGPAFAAVTFALLKAGVVPVFLDPGLGARNLLACAAEATPTVLVAMRPVLALRPLLRGPLARVRLAVSTGPFPGATSLAALAALAPAGAGRFAAAPADDGTTAAIAFTSGATGAPKGVVLTHGGLHAQIRVLRETFEVGAGAVQLAVLPLLALLGPGLGCATVLPDLDPARPARADPRRVVRALLEHRVTHAFGSPTLWEKVAALARRRPFLLPDLRVLLVGGAPVPPGLLGELDALLPAGRSHGPLGATEAITVASASGAEIAAAAAEAGPGAGSLVGRPVAGVEVRLVRIDDGPLAGDVAALAPPPGAPGEIVVRGPLVSAGYDRRPEADRLARIPAPGGAWHRLGDLGRLDEAGRLWFCGRKAERVETPAGLLLTACVEPLLAHPALRRVAVVGLGDRPAQRAVAVGEPRSAWTLLWPPARRRVAREVLGLAAAHPATRAVERVLLRRALPVDPRHAAKILRGALAAWAGGRA